MSRGAGAELDSALQAHLAAGGVHLGERVTAGPGGIPTPLSESASIGLGGGHAIAGRAALVDLVELAGLVRASDTLAELGGLHARSGGAWTAPVVIRVPVAPGETLPALPTGVRRLVVGAVADLAPALGAALAASAPVVIFVPTTLDPATPPAARADSSAFAATPLSLRDGAAVTLLADGAGVATAIEAAALLAERGIAASVVDLRGAEPAAAAEGARRTGRVVYVGHLGESALSGLVRAAFWSLESPPVALLPAAGAAAVAHAAQESIEA